MTFTGITQARARLERLAQGLREIAGGAVLARAAAKVKEQVDAVAKRAAGSHIESGAASSSLAVTASGGLVRLSSIGYLKFHAWWPFRRGTMPPFVVKRATLILAREIVAALGGSGGGAAGVEAAGIVDEANAAETEKAVGAVKKAYAKKANAEQRKRDSAQRRTDRKLDAATKKREARDG